MSVKDMVVFDNQPSVYHQGHYQDQIIQPWEILHSVKNAEHNCILLSSNGLTATKNHKHLLICKGGKKKKTAIIADKLYRSQTFNSKLYTIRGIASYTK